MVLKIIFRIFLILFSAGLFFLGYFFLPTGLSNEQIRFVVPMEQKQEDTIKQLRQEDFIRSSQIFSLAAGFLKFPGMIEPGAYMLSHRMTLLEVTNTLLFRPYQKWAVIVPGLRLEQTADKLANKMGWDEQKKKDFLENAKEGYMFPDTYLINVDSSGKDVATKLINNFNEKFDPQMFKDLTDQNVKLNTAVKIASLIERESGSDEDKPIIAGVIWNRLNQNMKLQIDAVAQYALGTQKDWWPHISPADLKIDNPYNTYLYKGLTPGPICSPSLASLKAVIYSTQTDCVFYLHDSGKNIHCSKTYEEHLDNIDQYLK